METPLQIPYSAQQSLPGKTLYFSLIHKQAAGGHSAACFKSAMFKQEKITAIFLIAVIALTSFLIYSPTLYNEFVWDDLHFTTNPARISSNPYSFFWGGGLYYRPVLYLSVVSDYSLWQLNPMGYHVTNTILHTLCSVLVFLVALYLTGNVRLSTAGPGDSERNTFRKRCILSFIAAMLFALHPIHTESVAWINGRTDVLATLFLLLGFLSYLLYVKEGKNTALVLLAVFFLFSLFSKENGIALIGLVLLYGLMAGLPRKKILLSGLALSAGLIVYLVLRLGAGIKEFSATPGSREAFFAPEITPLRFLEILSMGTGYYFEKLVAPFNLNVLPPFPDHPLYYLIFIVPFITGAVLYMKGKKLYAFLIAWIVITLLPSMSILFSQVAAPVAERYLYLPSVGFVILVSLLAGRIKSGKIAFITVFSILMLYGATTFDRLGDWKNDLTLWEDTVRKNPDSANAHINYASALIRTGMPGRAREELLVALTKKISFQQTSKILELLGVVETGSGNYKEAEKHLVASIKANNRNTSAYNNLGFLYASMAESPDYATQKKDLLMKSIKKYEEALRLSPGFLQPKFNMGLSYLKIGDFEKALQYFDSVIKSAPEGKMSARALNLMLLIKLSKGGKVKDI